MDTNARDKYLETEILTATPQRLRLMLIEGAIRQAHAASAAWKAGNQVEGLAAIGHCRDIIAELIAGIRPEMTPEAKQLLAVYMFLFATIVEAQFGRDPHRLSDVVRVLEEERQTWQAVCRQMPERAIAIDHRTEELAPRFVSSNMAPAYGPEASRGAPGGNAFSIDA